MTGGFSQEALAAALRLIRVVVPEGGCLFVFAESYFDETNTHDPREPFAVGGYVFTKEAAEEQARRWALLLTKWRLPFFHMVDCAHNTGVFSHLDKTECDLAAREAIQIIKETASTGIYVTVFEADYLEIMPKFKFFGSVYDSCARNVITGVASWIEASRFNGSMHYFFEAGADSEKNASYCLKEMMKDPELCREACYGGHTFIPKVRSPGVQTADVLAWHAGQHAKRMLRGEPIRKDFASLKEISHVSVHLTREILRKQAQVVAAMLKEAGLTKDIVNEIDMLARRTPKKRT